METQIHPQETPNFSILARDGIKTKEYPVDVLGPERAQSAKHKLELLTLNNPKNEAEQRRVSSFYASITTCATELSIYLKNKHLGKSRDFNNKGLYISKLTAELTALFIHEDLNNIGPLLENIHRNFSRAPEAKNTDPIIVNKLFSEGFEIGLKSSVEFYKSRSQTPLTAGKKRFLGLQSQLDEEHAVDFVEFITNEHLDIEELNFIQLKSKAVTPEETKKIQRKHEALVESMTSEFSMDFKDDEELRKVAFKIVEQIEELITDPGIDTSDLKKTFLLNKLLLPYGDKIHQLEPNDHIRLQGESLCILFNFGDKSGLKDVTDYALATFDIGLKTYLTNPVLLAMFLESFIRKTKGDKPWQIYIRNQIDTIAGSTPGLQKALHKQKLPIPKINSEIAVGSRTVSKTKLHEQTYDQNEHIYVQTRTSTNY